MRKYFTLLFIIFLFSSCNKIENTSTLNQEDIHFIKSLKLLENGEKIYSFYSEFTNEKAGNFFTDKRIAKYWIDKRNSKRNGIDFAYYKDISKIDTVYNAGATYCPYLLITKTNGSSFKVSVDGEKEDVKIFFEDALREWRKDIAHSKK
ncbi:hypothetical protein SGQ44_10040 [Flavobacterium sp. Fl-77]|uniref:Lipoprotein n=1 Tax=Flavobacterium flavipigmentatum TaxID=2893884 RepID=A0AAJ2SH22_9FLAO|nr:MULTISPECIES: hypothetical protein [unclassified Flavobacterium]MDX6182722.1 hypothetical protein [Flavobacterium sp. Fl-33]MDX6186099.1 hypothetical protein [Flavobacterium sp. Fl-77]UFH38248.1 hypothetical protein LNP22_16130 [Flavobacterium sp. F-70]